MSTIPKYHAGIAQEGALKLSSNESNFGLSEKVRERLLNQIDKINIYPDSQQTSLRKTIANHFAIDANQLILGNGSDEVLSLIAQSLLHKGDHAYTLSALETFSVYNIVSSIQQARYVAVPLHKGYIDLDAFVREGFRDDFASTNKSQAKLIFLCNPNNPTGTCLFPNTIKEFLRHIPPTSYVVLDEAYIDFAESSFHVPIAEKLSWHPNLIILRTFSKVFALGGIRLGIGIAREEHAKVIDAIRMPFNINSFAIEAGIASIEDIEFYYKIINTVRQERARMQNAYNALGFSCYDSQANFICLEVPPIPKQLATKNPADIMFDFFASHKVMIRSLTSFNLPSMVRITIGTPPQNAQVLEILAQWNKIYR